MLRSSAKPYVALMTIVGIAAAISTALASRGPQLSTSPDEFTIVPGVRFGPVREGTSRSALAPLFPRNAIRDAEINIGEGFCVPGTLVFPGTPDEAEVTWQDDRKLRVAFVRIKQPNGRWSTSSGVHVGSLLTDLEKTAGRVLTFSGFGWDWGGGLQWTEGGGSLHILLGIDPADSKTYAQAPDRNRIIGDHPVRSDDPLVRKLRVRVRWMTQSWSQVANTRDCL